MKKSKKKKKFRRQDSNCFCFVYFFFFSLFVLIPIFPLFFRSFFLSFFVFFFIFSFFHFLIFLRSFFVPPLDGLRSPSLLLGGAAWFLPSMGGVAVFASPVWWCCLPSPPLGPPLNATTCLRLQPLTSHATSRLLAMLSAWRYNHNGQTPKSRKSSGRSNNQDPGSRTNVPEPVLWRLMHCAHEQLANGLIFWDDGPSTRNHGNIVLFYSQRPITCTTKSFDHTRKQCAVRGTSA